MTQYAIIITAYNRSECLNELLKSLTKVRTEEEVTLIISIDNGGTNEVNKIAEEYVWPYGPKELKIHPEKKGLVEHFIWVGNQTERFDFVIFLEDDFLVSPELVSFSKQIYDFYKEDEEVVAASLYNPPLCEMTGCKFFQLQDGYDTYFLQQPYWGNIWFKEKWGAFVDYLKTYQEKRELLPRKIAEWTRSFKKIYIQYLIESHKYVVTPRVSLITNNGVGRGVHTRKGMYQFQNNLMYGRRTYYLCACSDSLSRYDAFMEIDPDVLKHYNARLRDYDFEVDTKGIRCHYEKEYVLTAKKVKHPIFRFSTLMKPMEVAVVVEEQGDEGLKLCRRENVVNSKIYYWLRRFKDIDKNYIVGNHTAIFIFLSQFKKTFITFWR